MYRGIQLLVTFLICTSTRAYTISDIHKFSTNGKTYWLSSWTATHNEAKTQCANTASKLTLFKNNTEYTAVATDLINYLKVKTLSINNVWVDLRTTDSNNDKIYEVWWEEEIVNMWAENQPNENCRNYNNECCARINVEHGLKDRDCSVKYYFLCTARNECQEGVHNCSHICQDQDVGFTCTCNRGYKLATNGADCEDVNECDSTAPNRCQQNCTNLIGSFKCECFAGYTLQADNYSCRVVDQCHADPKPCEQLCDGNNGSYSCRCDTGYDLSSDLRTCADIDECNHGNSKCTHGCVNTAGSYRCDCPSGFRVPGVDNATCVDINECQESSHTCSQICNNTNGSYFCTCLAGYQLDQADNSTCSDIDECALRPNSCGHTCVNQPGSYVCSCPSGFRIASDGSSCQQTMSYCPCSCSLLSGQKSVNIEALQQNIRQLSKNLTVDTHDLSAYVRARTSAPDGRPTSKTFGLFGSVLIGLILAMIVAMDVMKMFMFVYHRMSRKNRVVAPSQGIRE